MYMALQADLAKCPDTAFFSTLLKGVILCFYHLFFVKGHKHAGQYL